MLNKMGAVLSVLWALAASADEGSGSLGVYLTPRHMVLMQATMSDVWCSYFVGVQNDTGEEAYFESPLPVARDALEMQAQEGLQDSDIRIRDDGQLMVAKKFRPGLSLISVGYRIPATSGGATPLRFKFPYEVHDFAFASSAGAGLTLHAENFTSRLPHMLPSEQYRGVSNTQTIAKDSLVTVWVSGIPAGRAAFWWLGGVLFFVLFVGAGVSLRFARPTPVPQ